MNSDQQFTHGTILMVDDVPDNLNLLRQVLEPAGYRLLGATSGAAALQILARTLPDLVLLDVMMPDLDGFETSRQIRANPRTAGIPIIFVTARHEPEAILEGFRAGGLDYIVKPFQKEEVLARVKTHVDLGQLTTALSRRNTELEQMTRELQARSAELEEALANIKTLKGLIPICCHCKKIRDDRGFREQLEAYIHRHSEAQFSHGICPDCVKKYYSAFASPDDPRDG